MSTIINGQHLTNEQRYIYWMVDNNQLTVNAIDLRRK